MSEYARTSARVKRIQRTNSARKHCDDGNDENDDRTSCLSKRSLVPRIPSHGSPKIISIYKYHLHICFMYA